MNNSRTKRIRSLHLKTILDTFNHKCALTGKDANVQLDHFIPNRWGKIVEKYQIGGTTYANMIPLFRSINASKNAMNPFIWFDRYGDRHGVTLDKWNTIVEYIAEKHRMTTVEYTNRVNACYREFLAMRWIKRINYMLELEGEVHPVFIDNALRMDLNIHVVVETLGSMKLKDYFNSIETAELIKERKHVFYIRI